jgi:rabenosyn-5
MAVPYEAYSRRSPAVFRRVHSPSPSIASLPPIDAIIQPAHTPSHSSSSSLAPYRPGFQPKGVYRSLTDDFVSSRCRRRDTERVERMKLERRLEKLISLHFLKPPSDDPPPSNGHHLRRFSSSFDLDSIRNMDAGSLWRNMVSGGGKDSLRGSLVTARVTASDPQSY